MRATVWAILAVAGFGLMLISYFGFSRIDPRAPTAGAMLMLGDGAPGPQAQSFKPQTLRVRLLLGTPIAEALVTAMAAKSADGRRSIEAQVRPKLLCLAPETVGIGPGQLLRGRLPEPGSDEVLAGCQAPSLDEIAVKGRALKVVGVLRPDVALLAGNYLIPPDEATAALFADGDPVVRRGVLITLDKHQLTDPGAREALTAAFPKDRFARVGAVVRAARGPYYLYLGGLSLLLLGGSGVLIAIYRGLALRIVWRPLGAPLEALSLRWRLLWGLHLGYFGAVILCALAIYELPEFQSMLLTRVRAELNDGAGPLAVAGKAYLSGNVPRAAAITWAVNFFLGSIVSITLPSMVVPGVGALVAGFRAMLWGIVLAPTTVALSSAMLPHSWTLLLEGEGYILATYFALCIPIMLLRRDTGHTLLHRFGDAALLNLQAAVLIATVLLLAACYEATEVILMMRT